MGVRVLRCARLKWQSLPILGEFRLKRRGAENAEELRSRDVLPSPGFSALSAPLRFKTIFVTRPNSQLEASMARFLYLTIVVGGFFAGPLSAQTREEKVR